MGFISKLIVMFVGNGLGLYMAAKYVPGFNIPINLEGLIYVSLALTAINLFIRPVIKLVLSPLILLTLGLASVLVNLGMLYLLDYLLPSVTISGILPLLLATLVLGTINFVIHITTKIV